MKSKSECKSKSKSKTIYKILSTLVCIAFCTFGILVTYRVTLGDSNPKEQYRICKEHYDLLEEVANLSIDEENGINISKIPTDKVEYKIYNSDDNIIFKYCVKGDSSYKATIKLSNECKLIEKKYSTELPDYETFKKEYDKKRCALKIFTSVILAVGFICIIKVLYNFFKSSKNAKDEE